MYANSLPECPGESWLQYYGGKGRLTYDTAYGTWSFQGKTLPREAARGLLGPTLFAAMESAEEGTHGVDITENDWVGRPVTVRVSE